MFKKIFFHGISAGIFSATAAIVYDRIHRFATYTDFSKVINLGTLIGANLFICLLAAGMFWLLKKWLNRKADIIFPFVFTIFSFAAIIIPISAKLPLDIEYPELFPGLAIPMLFFPVLAWLTLKPVFMIEKS